MFSNVYFDVIRAALCDMDSLWTVEYWSRSTTVADQ